MIGRIVPTLLALALVALPALSQEGPPRPHFDPARRGQGREGRRILLRMAQAERMVSFSGREMVGGGDHSVEMLVKYDPRRGLRRESIPAGNLIVDNNERAWFLSTKDSRLVERESMQARMRDRWKNLLLQLGKTLKVERQGEDTIAGRIADIVLVKSREAIPGPSKRFWVDRETGLRLRIEERDPEGRIVFSAYFLSVDLNPTLRDIDFAAPTPPPGIKVIREKKRSFTSFEDAGRAGFAPRVPGFLPGGYTAQGVDVSGDGRWITAHWGNGLSVISMTEVRPPFPPPMRDLGKPEIGMREAGRLGDIVDVEGFTRDMLGGGIVTTAETQRLIGSGELDLKGYLLCVLVVVVVACLCMVTSRLGVIRVLKTYS